ncbi:hypothetical protein RZN05_01375 [Sphingomonas sp. HF-S4]|uniref:Uncharacterized protein n=1 Tax=Sphingomonas agrestis TaxID=3080540 RepID=A0ABU3Y319_9SPHN|nr:hypothetical protein [Sphingomonas sp. HF-S4]MDV3455618.1 hypothetical protein [Sphingomonas sp. HF-S4]
MNLPIPLVAGVLGGAVALGALVVPAPMLEGLVMASGLPAIVAAAEPPLGFTARALFGLGAGGSVAAFGWFALSILLGTRAITDDERAPESDAVRAPVLRRADAHPDAPPRPPLLATRDLGRPFDARGPLADVVNVAPALVETVPAEKPLPLGARDPAPEAVRGVPLAPQVDEPVEPIEQPLPRDLDQPLAAFDPAAMPEVPLDAPVVLPPLSVKPAVFEPSERFEVYELPTPPRAEPVPRNEAITRPETEASVHALLERLERGVIRKGIATGAEIATGPAAAPLPMTPPASAPSTGAAPRVERRSRPRGFEDTLITLRNLAARRA